MRTDEATDAAVAAATEQGLSVSGARVLRVGENGVVVFPAAGALARIVRGRDAVERVAAELRTADWLQSRGVPIARPMVPVPVVVDRFVVSFWEYLADGRPADLVTLAHCLRKLHSIPMPVDNLLPKVDPFNGFEDRLALGDALRAEDREFLGEFRSRLADQWSRASFTLGLAVVHGDAHMDNLLQNPEGRVAFIDLETVAVGPPEWDLTLTALYHECGWFSLDQYRQFADAYGYDVRTGSAWPILRGVRMLRMTTWLAQSAGDYPERERQLRHRLASLRDGTAPAGWTGF